MPGWLAVLASRLLFGMVLARVLVLKEQGPRATKFGNTEKTDFTISAFCPLRQYAVRFSGFPCPTLVRERFFHSEVMAWA
jgi:hypothetical protein